MPVRDTSLSQIVGREFNVNAVTHEYPDSISPHTARDGRQYHMIRIIQLNFKVGIRLLVHDNAGHFYQLFFHT